MSDATFISGNPESMAKFSMQTHAPEVPASLGRLGEPVSPFGTIEGILMTVLDKAATGVVGAFIANTSEDMTTISAKVKAAAAKYSATDLINSIDLATSTAKLADKGISLVKSLSGSGSSKSSGTTGTTSGSDTHGTNGTSGTSGTQHTGTGTTGAAGTTPGSGVHQVPTTGATPSVPGIPPVSQPAQKTV
ncbi:hypothetical protein FNH05_36770 [Amycolatopsis rhizosphaerae]|uniref:Uncharacterized protein n=1 Tax=Amycolatopsis rhizosphaerae TaxID=2053003 RepID=A0A557ZVV6_9PSEU|nr:hypothetical protein [Amycolatopsis rhizosphaerae]TVT16159.1 hypothetical protein FNH05_36770 [Amycolatopsis rhizosphaerae]